MQLVHIGNFVAAFGGLAQYEDATGIGGGLGEAAGIGQGFGQGDVGAADVQACGFAHFAQYKDFGGVVTGYVDDVVGAQQDVFPGVALAVQVPQGVAFGFAVAGEGYVGPVGGIGQAAGVADGFQQGKRYVGDGLGAGLFQFASHVHALGAE